MIPYVNIAAQWASEREELLPLIDDVLASGQYIGGTAVEAFEKSAANLCETKHCIALNSGTDALILGLAAMGVGRGDEVITPPNSFIASTAAISHIGAVPVFVDVLDDQNIDPSLIESAITKRTKAIMPVHLTGRMAKMDKIKLISEKYNIPIVEDAAQAIGSKYNNIPSGKWGKIGCFSTHPLKNLNGCGDGGFLVTDDDEVALKVKIMRNHGLVDRNIATRFGFVSRMDAVQATILKYRIKSLNKITEKRRENANFYRSELNSSKIFIPIDHELEYNTYHTFVIQVSDRDGLRRYLANSGVDTSIHYPIPIHLQPAAKFLGHVLGDFPNTEEQANKILTLPINQFINRDHIIKISSLINKFYA
jgi:dTDP-4-amino-4,6-dideoxygalactose transaminase